VLVGIAGVHFVVGELSRRGWIALPTIRNTRGIDVMATKENKSVQIQVKTRKNSRRFLLEKSAEKLINESLFYVFVNLKQNDVPEYFLIPSKAVSEYVAQTHKLFLNAGGRDSSMRSFPNSYKEFDLDKYKNKWKLLELE
jgi:hypothetical protein